MWDALLERDIKKCSSHGSWRGTGARSVFFVGDPPKNSMAAEDYRTAQGNIVTIVRAIQEHRSAPLAIGLQDSFWTAARSKLGPGFDGAVADGYVEGGGAGIVAAIAAASPRPAVLRLERDGVADSHARLEQAATAFMTESAPFFRALIDAYRDLVSRACSPEVRALQPRLQDAEPEGRLGDRVRRIARLARSLAIDLDGPAYRPFALHQQLLDLEDQFDEDGVKREGRALEQAILARIQPHVIDPRAAAELKLHELLDRNEDEDKNQQRIAELRAKLGAPFVEPLSSKVLRDLAHTVEFDHLMQGVRVRPEDQHRPLRGGDLQSRLLELAIVLNIDLASYPQLRCYVYYANLQHRLLELTGYAIGPVLLAVLDRLSRAVVQRLASPDEARLIEYGRAVEFFEDLGRFVLSYDGGLRQVLLGLDLAAFCQLLVSMGATLPSGWQRRATELGRRMTTVRELHDHAVLRAKDMASALITAMDERGDDTAILVCDGYMSRIVSTWFRGRDVSHSLLFPSWTP